MSNSNHEIHYLTCTFDNSNGDDQQQEECVDGESSSCFNPSYYPQKEYFIQENRAPYFSFVVESLDKDRKDGDGGSSLTVDLKSGAAGSDDNGKNGGNGSNSRLEEEADIAAGARRILVITNKDPSPIPLIMSLSSLNYPHSLIGTNHPAVVPTWRLKERMKTVGVCLILALNIGTDPPDLHKISPCAKLQCWLDPYSISRSKAREAIGQRLEQQYARWQPRARLRYKRALDPTIEEVRTLCTGMRRFGKSERLLLHYNGHGVPRPTPNGEIWLFDKDHTQYIPLSVSDLMGWIGRPSILVLDCSGSGVLMPFLTSGVEHHNRQQQQHNQQHNQQGTKSNPNEASQKQQGQGQGQQSAGSLNNTHTKQQSQSDTTSNEERTARSLTRDFIVLCPCSEGELLPMNPEFPVDIFTSCLTTPIPIALRWFVHQNPLSMSNLDPSTLDFIPGQSNDRKTPLGELNWIFTAVTDTIAWNVLPFPLFQRLFRQDLLVASMFRNFLLADRILRSLNCTPMSSPSLPCTSNHPLWQAWDLAVETCLCQLMREGYLNTAAVVTSGAGTLIPTLGGRDVPQQQPSNLTTPPPSLVVHTISNTNNHTLIQPPPSPLHPTANPKTDFSSSFFTEELTAFEVWMEFASHHNSSTPPEQLPIVLQVLLSQAHRVRALILLKQFLDLGPWAVNLALSVGILPYVLRLLKSHMDEYKHVLVGIWAKILAFDPSCQADLVKDEAVPHFIAHLNWGLNGKSGGAAASNAKRISNSANNANKHDDASDAAEQRIMAAFILSTICCDYPMGQAECLRKNLHECCARLLQSVEVDDTVSQSRREKVKEKENEKQPQQEEGYQQQSGGHYYLNSPPPPPPPPSPHPSSATSEERIPAEFRMWLCICLGNLCKDFSTAQMELYNSDVHLRILSRLRDRSPDVRAAAAYALGCCIGTAPLNMGDHSTNSNKMMARSGGAIPQLSISPSAASSPNMVTFPPSMGMGIQPPGGHHTIGLPPMGFTPMNAMPTNVNMPWQQHGFISAPPSSPQQPNSYNPAMGISPRFIPPSPPQPPTLPSVYEDNRRLSFDFIVGQKLAETAHEASPTVRYEAILALACLVDKYLQAFAAVADAIAASNIKAENTKTGTSNKSATTADQKLSHSPLEGHKINMNPSRRASMSDMKKVHVKNNKNETNQSNNNDIRSIPLPNGISPPLRDEMNLIWTSLRNLQHNDTHPIVASAANDIVSVVHEHMLTMKMEYDENKLRKRASDSFLSEQQQQQQKQQQTPLPLPLSSMTVTGGAERASDYGNDNNAGTGVRESSDPQNYSRGRPMMGIGGGNHLTSPPEFLPPPGARETAPYMLRVSSDHANLSTFNRSNAPSKISKHPLALTQPSSHPHDPFHETQPSRSSPIQYSLPKSQFYPWKLRHFSSRHDQKKSLILRDDPLSPQGAEKNYRECRNHFVHAESRALIRKFSRLALNHETGMPPTPSERGRENPPTVASDRNSSPTSDSAISDSISIVEKKKALRLTRHSLLRNGADEMTSMLRFHPYESLLVVCSGKDEIAIWDYQSGNKQLEFQNRTDCGASSVKHKKCRMTSLNWVNEATGSLLCVGSNDGSVRVWEGCLLTDNQGAARNQKPTLATSFFAAPDLSPGIAGSGLITEWQQYSGTLIAGGNSDAIRCWDLEYEKCCNTMDRKSGACVTTITTSWMYDAAGGTYSGISPNVVVAGYGDGGMRVFDLRMKDGDTETEIRNCGRGTSRGRAGLPTKRKRMLKLNNYVEHSSWIVDTFFTGYGGRHEVISGCLDGDIKFWDLRHSKSLRTLDVQRSPMTALAAHPGVPLLATGSQSQFIKILTLDGDTLDVIRYHDNMVNQRVGPVSCLCFHPHKMLLAAGATDDIVSLYSTDGGRSSA